jgi:hypothetical protein
MKSLPIKCCVAGFWFLCCSGTVAGTPQQKWLVRYDNAFSNGTHKPVNLAQDSSGNVIITGSSQNAQTNFDYVVIKYAPNGVNLWARRYDSVGMDDQVRASAVDKFGNVYLTGTSSTVKFAPDSDQQWTASYAGRALAVDTNGNAYVTGFSEVDFATVKLNPNGSNLWMQTYDAIGAEDQSLAVTVDQAGQNVYVAGLEHWVCESMGCFRRYAIIKYDALGGRIWVTNCPSWSPYTYGIDSEVNGLTVSAFGNVYMTANLRGTTGAAFYLIKAFQDGLIQWDIRLIPTSNEGVTAMVLDGNANAYLTGRRIKNFPNVVYQTYKLDGSGTKTWEAAYFGLTSGYHKANAIAVDTNGNTYVTGQSSGNGTGQDWATIKYDSDGTQQWVIRYDGPAHGNDEAVAIAVDNCGGVYVTGWQTVPGGGTEIVTIKYAEAGVIQAQPGGAMRVQFPAAPGQSYSFLWSSNLLDWLTLGTGTADTNGVATFDDTNAPLYPHRFYKGVTP